jgi:AcrR family transcriptional regulator
MRLFREKPYDEVTVEEICEASGVSRSSYYFHFENKDALLGVFDAMTARRAGEEVQARSEQPDTSLDAEIDVFISGLGRRARRMPKDVLARAMIHAMQDLPYVGKLPQQDADFGRSLAEAFRRAQSRGELPQTEDPFEMGAVLASMMMEAMLRWAYSTSSATSLDNALRWRADIFLRGVQTLRDPALPVSDTHDPN